MVGNEVVIRKACEADFEFILEANAAVSEKGSNTVLNDTERLKKDLFGKTARAAVIIAEVEGQADVCRTAFPQPQAMDCSGADVGVD